MAWDPTMVIFIQHQGRQTGPFSPQEIQAGLASGLYETSNLVWAEGMDGWIPLSDATHLLGGTLPPPASAPAGNSGLALASMILGIAGFFCGMTAIPAVICGHMALGKIKRAKGQLTGSGFAIAGLVTGYLGVFVFIAMLAGLTAPLVIRQRKKADQTQAMSNARSFSLSLMEFETEYGKYPNADTASAVATATKGTPITGVSSNARFRQLFQAGMTQSEVIFYAKSAGSRKPDGDISGDNALAPGECGFGYIENIRTDDGAARPLAMAPFKPGTTEFDPMPFDGKAVILFSDNSLRSLDIERLSGEVMLEGRNILDPTHPIWGGVPPSLLLPE